MKELKHKALLIFYLFMSFGLICSCEGVTEEINKLNPEPVNYSGTYKGYVKSEIIYKVNYRPDTTNITNDGVVKLFDLAPYYPWVTIDVYIDNSRVLFEDYDYEKNEYLVETFTGIASFTGTTTRGNFKDDREYWTEYVSWDCSK